MPTVSTPPSAQPHKSTSQDHGYFSLQATSSSSSATSTIPVITPHPTDPSPVGTPPSAYYPSSEYPFPQSEMVRLAARPAPMLPSLSAVRHSASGPSPHVMTFHRAPSSRDIPSPMDRPRRTPPPTQLPNMTISSTPANHTLHVQLPVSIQPEMITIAAQKGDKLKVVADAWHMENDCHYEWEISFPPHDIDMTAIQAKLEPNGHLYIYVRRLTTHYLIK